MLTEQIIEDIINLDEINMSQHFINSGNIFDKNSRRKGIEREIKKGAVFFTDYKNDNIIAYVEYLSENNIGTFPSIQLNSKYPNLYSLLKIAKDLYDHLSSNTPMLFKSNCHKSNEKSLKFHIKLGFRITGYERDRILFEIQGVTLLNNIHRYINRDAAAGNSA